MNPRAPRFVVVLSLLLAGSTLACSKGGSGKDAPKDSGPPVHVDKVTVAVEKVPRVLTLTGSLRGERETDLAANANGRVTKTLVERGAVVKEGQVVAQLDVRSASLTAAEAAANADLARQQEVVAKRECERYASLVERGTISRAEYDKVKDQCTNTGLSVQAAKARADVAAQVVGDGIIRAPFSGTVTERYVEVGAFVRQDTRVVRLVTLDSLRLVFTVPESHLTKVKEGAEVLFRVASFPDRSFIGKIRYVGASVRESTRDLVVEATVVNKPDAASTDKTGILRPGMFASVDIVVGEDSLPVVPKTSITEKDGRSLLFVVANGRVEERVVQTGVESGTNVSVVRGLSAGDLVVTHSESPLRNGLAVN